MVQVQFGSFRYVFFRLSSVQDITFFHYLPAALAKGAVLNVAFADELANQGFTAITKPASAHIRLFIL